MYQFQQKMKYIKAHAKIWNKDFFWKYLAGESSIRGKSHVSPKNHHAGRIPRGNQSRGEKNSGGTG